MYVDLQQASVKNGVKLFKFTLICTVFLSCY